MMRLDSPVDVIVPPVCHPQGRTIIVKGLEKNMTSPYLTRTGLNLSCATH